jgi:hypothetical protein
MTLWRSLRFLRAYDQKMPELNILLFFFDSVDDINVSCYIHIVQNIHYPKKKRDAYLNIRLYSEKLNNNESHVYG